MIRVDNTILSAMAKCPMQAYLRHVAGYTSCEESMFLKAGHAVHEALASHLRGASVTVCLDVLRTEYESWAAESVPPDHRLSYANVYEVLQLWLQQHPLERLPFSVDSELIEVGFQYPLDEHGDYIFIGRYDAAVYDDQTGVWFVLDHKTTGNMSAENTRMYSLDSQMSGYIWALQNLVQEQVLGAYINMIELSKLPAIRYKNDGTPYTCITHKEPIDRCRHHHMKASFFLVGRTPDLIEAWRINALNLARQFEVLSKFKSCEGVNIRGMFNRSCMWCEFSDLCATGRQAHIEESGFTKSPWSPWEEE